MTRKIVHITNDKGGSLEMTKKISYGLSKYFQSNVVMIGKKDHGTTIPSIKLFDEDLINYSRLINNKTIKSADIVILHYILGYSTIILFLVLKCIMRKRMICVFHSNMDGPGSILRRIYYLIRKNISINLLTLGDRLIFISEYQKSKFGEYAIWKTQFFKKSIVISNCIDTEWIINNPKIFSTSSLNVLYVGRITKFKGKETLERIIKLSEEDEFKYTLVGNGKLSNNFDKVAVEQINQVSQSRLQKIYDQNDVLIVTSHTETFGLVILEAMSRGLVVVSTKLPQIEEYFKNGINGFLYRIGDSDHAVKLLRRIARSKTLMKEISKANVETARAMTCNISVEEYKNTIDSLLGTRS